MKEHVTRATVRSTPVFTGPPDARGTPGDSPVFRALRGLLNLCPSSRSKWPHTQRFRLEEPVIDAIAPSPSRKALLLAALASVALHLLVLQRLDFGEDAAPNLATTLRITLLPRDEPQRDQPATPERRPDPPAGPRDSTAKEGVEPPVPPATTPEIAPGPRVTDEAIRAAVTTFLSRRVESARSDPECTRQQRATRARLRCREEETGFEPGRLRRPGAFDIRMGPLSNGDQLRRDMVRVGRLLDKQRLLDEIARSKGYMPEDLAVMKRELTEEIDHIDRGYASADLFKVLGAAAKQARNLIEATRAE